MSNFGTANGVAASNIPLRYSLEVKYFSLVALDMNIQEAFNQIMAEFNVRFVQENVGHPDAILAITSDAIPQTGNISGGGYFAINLGRSVESIKSVIETALTHFDVGTFAGVSETISVPTPIPTTPVMDADVTFLPEQREVISGPTITLAPPEPDRTDVKYFALTVPNATQRAVLEGVFAQLATEYYVTFTKTNINGERDFLLSTTVVDSGQSSHTGTYFIDPRSNAARIKEVLEQLLAEPELGVQPIPEPELVLNSDITNDVLSQEEVTTLL